MKNKTYTWIKALSSFFFAMVVALIIGGATGAIKTLIMWESGASISKEEFRSKENIQKLVDEMNEELPKMLHPEVRGLKCAAAEGLFIYNQQFINKTKSEFGDNFHAQVYSEVRSQVCEKDFVAVGVTSRYNYWDKNMQHITSVEIFESDCNAP